MVDDPNAVVVKPEKKKKKVNKEKAKKLATNTKGETKLAISADKVKDFPNWYS